MKFYGLLRNIVWLIFPLFFVNCYRDKEVLKDRFYIKQELSFNTTQNVFIVENPHNYQVQFYLKIDDCFPLNNEKVKQIIELKSIKDQIPIEQAAWMFVSENTFNTPPYTKKAWQHHPLLFLNSIGGGYCDDISTTLVSIWENWFDSARVVNLGGHVVAEVKSNGDWKMFDADKGVAYLDENKKVCSIDELEDSVNWISNPKQGYVLSDNISFKYPTQRAKKFARLYASDSNNVDATSWHSSYTEVSNMFILPSNSKLEFIKDSISLRLIVHCNKSTKGKLQLPFVPYKASGNIVFVENGKTQIINSKNYLFSNNKFHNNLQIVKVGEESKIEYLVNPKMSEFLEGNRLYVSSSDSLILSTQYLLEPTQDVLFGAAGLYYSAISTNYKNVLEEWINLDVQQFEYEDWEALFSSFLTKESKLSKNQISEKISSFNIFYKSIANDRKKINRLKNTFPEGPLFLFAAIRDNKQDYFMQLADKHE